MEEESAAKITLLQQGPAATGDPVSLIMPVEGELNCRLAIPLDDSIIKIRLYCQQSQASEAIAFERQMCGTQQIEIVGAP